MFGSDPTGVTAQAEAALQREGLPFWILWFLLFIILLLLAFIFLRNKDLRQRLSLSLYGPRRRFDRLALQARLIREKRKRSGLLQALGRTALRNSTACKDEPDLLGKLAQIEAQLDLARGEMRRVSAEMEQLHVPPDKQPAAEAALPSAGRVRKEMKSVLSEIISLEKRQDPLLEELGAAVYAQRPSDEAFLPLYAQIDLGDETIAELTASLDNLGKK